MAVSTVVAMSFAVTPSCAARCGSILKVIAGPLTTTAMVEVLHDGAPVRRLAVQVRLNLSERAARPGVARGSIVTLVIQRGSATVSANGVALQDSEIGKTASFKVQPTGRIVQARIESASMAMVLEQP